MYIYESHMGGLYVSDIDLEYDDLYCEVCNDCDLYIGYADTRAEALFILNDSGYDEDYIREFIDSNWEEN